jgi:hypothetical protein
MNEKNEDKIFFCDFKLEETFHNSDKFDTL